ncbi:MFS transporter [Ectobacillus ponti]|uniref:MFS transporter n=1 Tax=Ectobacillus ponti TaxID=2961894 RepID=A0AA42BSF4_9BACI|nr:MFS transporter [Ectobacillus ponti]MCP8968383.1 MFS transporter [Ectobacillus ponti]
MQVKQRHYAWTIFIITFCSMLTAAIIRSSSGVLMVPLEKEFGWSRSSISLAVAVNLVLYGLSGPFAAALMERYGLRKVMTGGMLLLVIGLGLTTVMTAKWQLFVLWGLVLGAASGVFLTVLGATVANRWFVKNKGLIIGMLTASTATGQLAFLPLLAYLAEHITWRASVLLIAGLGTIFLVIISIWMRNSPAEVGAVPYGAPADYRETRLQGNPVAMAFSGLREGARRLDFWLLAGSFFICGLSTSGLIGTHFIPACIHAGIPELQAAGLLAFMGIFDIVGTTLSGWLSDRFNNRWLLFWYYGLRGLALLLLPYALFSNSYLFLIVFAVFYGLDWIATVPPTVKLTTEAFGREKGGVIYGWIFASHQIGSGIAAYGGGVLFTWMDTYTMAFMLAGSSCLIATLLVLRVGGKAQVAVTESTSA